MIYGTGVDIVGIERIRRSMERHGESFLLKVFTPDESAECMSRRDPAPGLAARFAAKEAAMKALGTGWSVGVGWLDLEVISGEMGKPSMVFHGGAGRLADELGVTAIHLSLSHEEHYAVAMVILER